MVVLLEVAVMLLYEVHNLKGFCSFLKEFGGGKAGLKWDLEMP